MADEPTPRGRLIGLDVARGLAVVLMIQTHAYDGWVAAAARGGAAFRLTRFLGTFPLPSFLMLAGAGIALRAEVGIRKGEPAAQVRTGLVERGLEILMVGYLVNAIYFAMDGGPPTTTILRGDVLHAIGLGLAIVAGFAIRPSASDGSPDRRRLARVAGLAALVFALVSIPANRWAATLRGPVRFVAAPFVDVPGLAKMPLFPLGTWLALGVGLSLVLSARREAAKDDAFAAVAGAPRTTLLGLFALAPLVSVVAYGAMLATVDALGGPLDRTHPAILWNLVDLGARATFLVALSGLVSTRLPAWALAPLVLLGRSSLVAYAFHIPFCYGRIARPIARSLGMGSSTALFVGLVALTYGVVRAEEAWKQRRRSAPPAS